MRACAPVLALWKNTAGITSNANGDLKEQSLNPAYNDFDLSRFQVLLSRELLKFGTTAARMRVTTCNMSEPFLRRLSHS